MKTTLKSAILLSLLVPSFAIAGEARNDAPAMPGVMTTAGHKFANQCSDQAFARADDQDRLARKCVRLLAWWREQADLRVQRHANPRLMAVETASADRGANLAFDTVAAFRNAPLLSSVGASASR
jgi:hypothetical protein